MITQTSAMRPASRQTRVAPVAWPFSLSAALGKGIKNPSFIERFGYYTSFLGNPDLDPESSESWDIGLHVGDAESAFRFSLHVYASELNNEINGFSFSPALGAFTAVNEDGISEREGVEFEGGYQMTDLLNWRWSYQYTRSTSPSGELELRRPKHTGFIGLNASLKNWQLCGQCQTVKRHIRPPLSTNAALSGTCLTPGLHPGFVGRALYAQRALGVVCQC